MCNFSTLRTDGCFDLFLSKMHICCFPMRCWFCLLGWQKKLQPYCLMQKDVSLAVCVESSILMCNFTPLKVRWMLLSFLSLMRIWCFPVSCQKHCIQSIEKWKMILAVLFWHQVINLWHTWWSNKTFSKKC